jgi:hypothetical protein
MTGGALLGAEERQDQRKAEEARAEQAAEDDAGQEDQAGDTQSPAGVGGGRRRGRAHDEPPANWRARASTAS